MNFFFVNRLKVKANLISDLFAIYRALMYESKAAYISGKASKKILSSGKLFLFCFKTPVSGSKNWFSMRYKHALM